MSWRPRAELTTGVLRWPAVGLLLALVAVGLLRTHVDTNVTSFVPHGDKSYDDLLAHDREFGGEPIVVLLHGTGEQGLFLDAGQLLRLIRLEGDLSGLAGVKVVYGPGTVLNQTGIGIRNVLQQIAGGRDSLCNLAKARVKSKHGSVAQQSAACDAAIAKFDKRYGSLIAQAMPVGLPTVANPRFVASVLFDQAGNPKPQWKFLVPDAKSATVLVRPKAGLSQSATARLVSRVTQVVGRSGLRTSTPVITGVPVLTAAVAAKARSEAFAVGAVALLGVGLVFFLSPWSRRRRFRLLPLSAALLGTASTVALFGWFDRPLSLGVVAFMPILLGIGSDFPLYLAQPSRRARVLAAAAAGAAAFASLALTPLAFVQELGIALAIGICLTVGWSLLLRTFVRAVEPQRPAAIRRFAPVPVGIVRTTAVVGCVAAVAGWVLIGAVRIESSPQHLASGLSQLDALDQAEQTLGFSGELDIELHGRNVVTDSVFDWERRAEAAVVSAEGDRLRPLLTYGRLLAFLGGRPTADQLRSGTSLVPPYLMDAVIAPDRTTAASTFGVKPQDVREQGDLVRAVERDLPPPPRGYTVSVTGLPVLASHGLDAMSANRYLFNLVGLVAAALVLLILLRTWRDAAAAVVTAVLATGWMFAGVALSGATLSPLTMVIGALITVTSFEFATMLAAGPAERPWTHRSVLVAACAGTVGYAALTISGLAVLRGFGIALAAGVVCSYLAARLVHATWPRQYAPPPGGHQRTRRTATRTVAPAAGRAKPVESSEMEVSVR